MMLVEERKIQLENPPFRPICLSQRERRSAWRKSTRPQNAGASQGATSRAVHLGDVVEESDGDLMGDGANVAMLLQPCPPAEPADRTRGFTRNCVILACPSDSALSEHRRLDRPGVERVRPASASCS